MSTVTPAKTTAEPAVPVARLVVDGDDDREPAPRIRRPLAAAAELKFELAARLRDEVQDLKKELRAMERAGHA